jgi:branched-chain amino acid transport system ATP-binding protein
MSTTSPERAEHGDRATGDVLVVDDLRVNYGAVVALRGISLRVGVGEAVAVVGPNGSGKTTLLRTLSGLIKPRGGRVDLGGVSIVGKRPYKIARAGFSHVPEGRGTIASLSVEENLMLAAPRSMRRGRVAERVHELCEAFPALGRYRRRAAGMLSGGEQQMLVTARGLMSEPKVLAIDEPSMGLAPIVVGSLIEMLHAVTAQGVSVLLVEQNTALAAEVAERSYVLVRGRIEAEGSAADLPTDMIATYLA